MHIQDQKEENKNKKTNEIAENMLIRTISLSAQNVPENHSGIWAYNLSQDLGSSL